MLPELPKLRDFSEEVIAINETISQAELALINAACFIQTEDGPLAWEKVGRNWRIVVADGGEPIKGLPLVDRKKALKHIPKLMLAAQRAMEGFVNGAPA